MNIDDEVNDIAATQAEHTLFLASIVERLDEHASLLKAIETSIQLLSANITNMRTEIGPPFQRSRLRSVVLAMKGDSRGS